MGDEDLRELERLVEQGNVEARGSYALESVHQGDYGYLLRMGFGPYDLRAFRLVVEARLLRFDGGAYPFYGYVHGPRSHALTKSRDKRRTWLLEHAPDESPEQREAHLDFDELEAARERGDSQGWRAAIEAQDDPDAWLLRAGPLASDDLVGACLAHAAAEWLSPSPASQALGKRLLERRRREVFKPGFVGRADLVVGFEQQPVRERHWRAWAFKSPLGAVFVPDMLAYAADENFSIRTRIYRSLGQQPHPASIQCLHEGTFDPHPFARTQAVRSLGWIGDPTCLARLRAIQEDPDADREVLRAVAQALQRIGCYWLLYGEWDRLGDEPEGLGERIRTCLIHGIPQVVSRLKSMFPKSAELTAWRAKLADPVRRLTPPSERRQYSAYFGEAQEFEDRLQLRPSRLDLEARLGQTDPDEVVLALAQASRRGRADLADRIAQLTEEPHPDVSWHARRALRKLGLGTLDQRRTLPAPWAR